MEYFPFFTSGIICPEESEVKNCPNSFMGSDKGDRKTIKNLITCDIDKMRAVRLPFPGKNDLHIGVLAGFRGSGWDKLRGKNSLDLTVIGGL